MPIILGLAAYVAFASDLDQAGVDPQVDKQYAIVKQGTQVLPSSPKPGTSTVTTGRSQPESLIGGLVVPSAPSANSVCQLESQAGVATQSGSTTTTTNTVTTNQGTISITVDPVKGTQSVVATGQAKPLAAIPGDIRLVVPGNEQRTIVVRPAMAYSALSGLKGMNRKVSVKFNNASASEVLRWLSKQNVNFVANVDKLPKSKITMNVSNVPLSEALESVAESLGGMWQVKGSTLIFRTGLYGVNTIAPFAQDRRITIPRWNTQGGELKLMPFNNMKDMPFSGEEFKSLFKLDDKTLNLDDKSMAELKKQLLLLKDQKWADGQAFKLDGKSLEDSKRLMLQLKEGKGTESKGLSTLVNKWGLKKFDAKKFMETLTSSQKEIMKKQGFLKLSDLTDDQKGLLFDNPNGQMPTNFTIVFNLEGESVTIKN